MSAGEAGLGAGGGPDDQTIDEAVDEAVEARLVRPGEIAFHLDLTAAQLKIVHTALRSLVDDLGREQHDVRRVALAVLDKLPGEHDIRAIDITRELRESGE